MKQTWRNNDYLYGYDQGAETVRAIRDCYGWARGKGYIKRAIRETIEDIQIGRTLTVIDNAYLDAYLDSVGC
jgi:uncharacterized protein (UPF0335 family)